MTTQKDWLPPLIEMSHAKHVWADYCDLVYAAFKQDFLNSQPTFGGMKVQCRRDPISDGREAGFWHCVSTGTREEDRVPDTLRCERIKWARAIIENAADPRVSVWERRDGSDVRVHLWFEESYLVVIGERRNYYQLVTAFCTERDHYVRKKRRERDACKKLTPPF